MKTNTFLLLQILGLLFFGLNYYFEFIQFENTKTNSLCIVFISVFSLLFYLKKRKTSSKNT